MKEELLNTIKKEANKEIIKLDKYNAYARKRNQVALKEKIMERLGLRLLPYGSDLGLLEKTETDVIMSIYKKYISTIDEEDTNDIYVYWGTYMSTSHSYEDICNGAPFEEEVDRNDPRATYRAYWNLEGVWSKHVYIGDCEEFEKTHTVIYNVNFDKVQEDFIVTAVNEGQEEAVNKILTKYKK